jgi:hypothetical protein
MTPEPGSSTPPPLEASLAPSGAAQPRRMGELSRLIGVFFSPSEALADVARRPTWWVPVVLSALIGIAFVSAISSHIGWDQIVQQQFDQSQRTQNMTGAQRAAALQTAERIAPVIGYVGSVVGALFAVFVIAVVLMFLFDNIMGTNIGLNRMMAIVAYAGLPRILMTGLAILVMFLKSPDDFDIRNPLVFNIGALIPRDTPQWERTLGGSFDLFTFWVIALTAMGICAAAPKMKFGKALSGILFPWALYVILITGYSAAMG